MAGKRKGSRARAAVASEPVTGDALLRQVTKGVKMVQNPAGFQEPAAVVDDGSGQFAGSNPYPAGTWRHIQWDRLKKHSGA